MRVASRARMVKTLCGARFVGMVVSSGETGLLDGGMPAEPVSP
jgi:hypothetical protein